MPEHFRFTAKFPRDISHEGDLRDQLEPAFDFTRLMAPLGQRVAPYWLQLPAQFSPARLGELCHFLDEDRGAGGRGGAQPGLLRQG